MKRFHIHMAVNDLAASAAFYSRLFGRAPDKLRDDYAKWMLEDPRVNFAISARSHAAGINHLGIQAGSAAELAELKALAEAAAPGAVRDQEGATCCYASSDKHWTLDPQGLAWEHFLTRAEADAFGDDTRHVEGACCIPLHAPANTPTQAAAACCVPGSAGVQGGCCA
jgi:hypothetical protein